MSGKEYTAKTIEEALEIALNEMMLTRDDIEYVVISQPSKGFLGIGGRPAVIRVSKKNNANEVEKSVIDEACSDNRETVKEDKIEKIIVPEKEKVVDLVDNDYDPEEKGREFLQKIFDEMKLNVKIDVIKKENYLTFNLTGENLGILIGRRGDTLDALQFLLNLVINEKNSSRVKGIIDVENYRQKREETLIGLSYKLAAKARKTGQKVVLEPMNPQERRIIHIALQDDKRVTTYSEGEEPYRKVVIVPEKKNYDKKQYHHSKNKPQA